MVLKSEKQRASKTFVKKKIKLQVPSKARGLGFPKWIPPEKRMRVYNESILQKDQKWVQFMIVAPDQDTKEQLQAGFEFIHDNNHVMNNDYMAINSIAHSYIDESLGGKGVISPIVVDKELYRQLLQRACKHDGEHYFYDNIEFCKHCHKCLA
jgi:predicted GNAT family acetyltransferase